MRYFSVRTWVIGFLHDPANVEQTSSKCVQNIHELLVVCWTFAGSCTNTLLDYGRRDGDKCLLCLAETEARCPSAQPKARSSLVVQPFPEPKGWRTPLDVIDQVVVRVETLAESERRSAFSQLVKRKFNLYSTSSDSHHKTCGSITLFSLVKRKLFVKLLPVVVVHRSLLNVVMILGLRFTAADRCTSTNQTFGHSLLAQVIQTTAKFSDKV